MLLVLLQVEIDAMRDPFQLTKARRAKRKAVLDVERTRAFFRVVRELVFVVRTQAQVGIAQPEITPEARALFAPELVPLHRFVRAAKPLELHLLELARAEDVIAWRDFVTERFTDLRDAERH